MVGPDARFWAAVAAECIYTSAMDCRKIGGGGKGKGETVHVGFVTAWYGMAGLQDYEKVVWTVGRTPLIDSGVLWLCVRLDKLPTLRGNRRGPCKLVGIISCHTLHQTLP